MLVYQRSSPIYLFITLFLSLFHSRQCMDLPSELLDADSTTNGQWIPTRSTIPVVDTYVQSGFKPIAPGTKQYEEARQALVKKNTSFGVSV